jgi:hypothetical protein
MQAEYKIEIPLARPRARGIHEFFSYAAALGSRK